jgi:glycosyltransferase involved in cell wall biosynthesis
MSAVQAIIKGLLQHGNIADKGNSISKALEQFRMFERGGNVRRQEELRRSHIRVLFATKSQLNRGSYLRLYPIALGLSRNGFKVTLICPHEFRELRLQSKQINENFRLILLPRFFTRTHYPGILLRSLIMLMLIGKGRYDLMHVCSPAFLDTWSVSAVGRFRKIPTIVDIDDLWGFTKDRDRNYFESLVEEFLLKTAVAEADRVIVATDILQRRYSSYTSRAIEVLPNGIDSNDFKSLDRGQARMRLIKRLNLKPEDKIILSQLIGDQSQLAHDLTRRLKVSGFDIAMIIPGALPNDGQSNSEGAYKKVENVYLFPRVERTEFLDMLVGSDILLFSMKNTEWEMARFPIRLTEFLASGTPLLSIPFGECRRVLEMAGYGEILKKLRTSADAESLAFSIRYYITHAEDLRGIAECAAQYVFTNLTWAQITDRLASIYDDVMKWHNF